MSNEEWRSDTHIFEHWNDPKAIRAIFEHEPENKHVLFLLEQLRMNTVSYRALAQYGMQELPIEAERPNPTIATYFFLISELRGIPDTFYQFALEAMVYAKNQSDFPTTTRDEVVAIYEKTVPTLV